MVNPYRWLFLGVWLVCAVLSAEESTTSAEYLVKLDSADSFVTQFGGQLEVVSQKGKLYKWTVAKETGERALALRNLPGVAYIQRNHVIRLIENPSIARYKDALLQYKEEIRQASNREQRATDNPEIQAPTASEEGTDPLMEKAWGLSKIGATSAWNLGALGGDVVVAITDTGVDYNHKDLIQNMWRNTNEIPNDGIDNDSNGFVDDVVGWDFVAKDNKPYDLSGSTFEILFAGANPGHGTHCAGVVAASFNNKLGASGVAPKAKLMALRFLSEKGMGSTEDAILAVDYAVENGAQIISASWGSEGEEEGDMALQEAIQRAQDAGVLFIAAAGNGRNGMGYDNDKDAKPSFPATYPHENIISVAALDVKDAKGGFSNFGKTTVDIGAPGVQVLSTVPGDKYQDTIVDFAGMKVTWDGTSMATPHVSGAAAVLWSHNPGRSWAEIKTELLEMAVPVSSMTGKVVTDGRLDLSSLK